MAKLQRPSKKVFKLIFIVLLIAAVAAGSWLVWQAFKPKTKPVQTTQAPETKYLDITDWGVRMTLTDNTFNAYASNRVASPLVRALGVRTLKPETGCTDEPVAYIYRVQKDSPDPLNRGKKYTDTQQGNLIDDNFYFIISGPQKCPNNADSQAKLDKVRSDFLAATPSIEKL